MEHGLDVRALTPRRSFDPPSAVASDLPVEVVELPAVEQRFAVRQVERLRHPMGALRDPRFLERVRDRADGVDVVHLEEVEAAWGDVATSVPAVAHLHYRARLDASVMPLWRATGRTAVERALAERRAIGRHRYLLANSARVAETLRRDGPHALVQVAPLTLDPSSYVAAEHEGPPVAGIIGTATWPPTAAAIQRLVARVWPLVRRSCPEATLRIAGRGTETLDVGEARGVEVVGPVESAAAFFRGLSCLLYPVPRGSGMKVKVLESLACGVPVLTTAFGAEGIPPSPAVDVSEGDDELAHAAADLLRDAETRRQRGAEAMALFHSHFAPKPATAPLLDLYQRMSSAS
jgi:glycosyltransferase involved in cell wall biosynthesis